MADVREYEKIAREIEKIRTKKHRALKAGRIEENIALNRYFKLLIESLRLGRWMEVCVCVCVCVWEGGREAHTYMRRHVNG